MADADTKTQILDAAQDLIQRWGANGMSYQHISDAVGIRKASIHHHFPTKENLIEALIDRYSAHALKVFDGIVKSDATPTEKLRQYIALFEATLRSGNRDKACPMGMLGAELTSLGASSTEKVRQFYEMNEERLICILDEGRKTKEFRFQGDLEATADLIFSLLEGAVLIARAQGGVKHFKMIAQQLLALLRA
jgi:TetR/AcrR family transcriptional repressor of nem operon